MALAEVEVEVGRVLEGATAEFIRIRGFTGREVARRLEIDPALMSKMLRNERPMSYRLLLQLATLLNVEPTALAQLRVVQPATAAAAES